MLLALCSVSNSVQAQVPVEAPTASAPLVRPVPRPVPPAAPVVSLGSDQEWRALTPQQRQFLAALEQQWSTLDSSHKSKWLELAARHPQLAPEEQRRVEERMAAWARLSPAERQQARIAFQAAQQVRPSDRQAKWEAYQALPAERRQELMEKAAQKQRELPAAAAAPNKPAQTGARPAAAPLTAPAVLQVKPGATTVPLSSLARQAAPAGQGRPGAHLSELDARTLLPRQAASAPANKP